MIDMTEDTSGPTGFAGLLDNIWLQLVIATGITVIWLVWIMFEILFR